MVVPVRCVVRIKLEYERLQNELIKDGNRLWMWNHGRDDQIISYWDKEPQYPFLDERVVTCLSRAVPLYKICHPALDRDKLILRLIARDILNLPYCSTRIKCAIQFSTRIAKQTDKRTAAAMKKSKQTKEGSNNNNCGTRHIKGTDKFYFERSNK